jgi:hypothetical protein
MGARSAFLYGILAVLAIGTLHGAFARAEEGCRIGKYSVGPVSLGDSGMVVAERLPAPRYEVSTSRPPGSAAEVVVKASGVLRLKCALDSGGKVFAIDVYDPGCTTDEGIGPGSNLSSTLRAYGEGKIDPTDRGYFVFFDRLQGIEFLIDNRDIPPKLRDIPDDVLQKAQEQELLSLENAKISMVEVVRAE